MGLINYTQIENGDAGNSNLWNQRFGQIIEQINGNIEDVNIKPGSITVVSLANDIYAKMYPIGSLYFNATDNTNPADLLGFGTWTAFAAGRVPVGIDVAQTEFNSPEKTGGHKALASHTHTGTTSSNGAHTHNTDAQVAVKTSSTVGLTNQETDQFSWGTVATTSNGAHTHTFTTASAGTGDSGNLQPYIVCYIWKRTG